MSKKFTLNQADLSKILVGAAIAASGAVLTYIAQIVGQTDFGVYTPVVVAVMAILVNTGKKFVEGR